MPARCVLDSFLPAQFTIWFSPTLRSIGALQVILSNSSPFSSEEKGESWFEALKVPFSFFIKKGI
jgi:hypothetical protein